MEEDEIIPCTFDLPMYMMPHHISGIRTGYYELNKLLSGWQKDEYAIVGYTNHEDANEFISNNASASNRVGSRLAIISANKAIYYTFDDNKKTVVLHYSESIFDLIRRARSLVRENGIKAMIIDDIKKIRCQDIKFDSKENTYYHISRSLCRLCRELKIPVISLVPINAKTKDLQLSFLRSLGSLARDADVVILLTRGIDNKLTPLVTKHRNGDISNIYR